MTCKDIDLREVVARTISVNWGYAREITDAVLSAVARAGYDIVKRPAPWPCCFDITGSDRVRGRDEPCRVCPERAAIEVKEGKP